MKLLLLSDLHFEFHKDGGMKFIQGLNAEGVDALVLASDIFMFKNQKHTIGIFKAFKKQGFKKCFFVNGNHSYYKNHFLNVDLHMRDVANCMADFLVFLEPYKVHEWEGKRFFGGTLWFPYKTDNKNYQNMMNDFYQIKGFLPDGPYHHNELFRQYYDNLGVPGDILITHHLPRQECVAPQWVGSELNRFFVGEIGDLIDKHKPALCLFGHTHDSVDFKIGDTRYLCNPFGYDMVGHRNKSFNRDLIIDI